jgi:hypothetical protein
MVLRRLGNRLALQQADSKVAMPSAEYADLENLIQQTGRLLKQLQKRQGSGLTPRGLHRFKWSQGEVDSIRSQISTLCAIIAAFNSSIVLPDISHTPAKKVSRPGSRRPR